MKKFEFLEHTADIKIRVRGKSLNELFENAVTAFSHYIAYGKKIPSKKINLIKLDGSDIESLLSKFLDELIFLVDSEGFLPSSAEVSLEGLSLQAKVHGDSVKNQKINQVKAATYAEMYVKKTAKEWEAQFVLDV